MTDDPIPPLDLTSDELVELNFINRRLPRKLQFWHKYGDASAPQPQTQVGDALHIELPIFASNLVDDFTVLSMTDAHRLWVDTQIQNAFAPLGQPFGRYYVENTQYRRDFTGGTVTRIKKGAQDE